MTEPSEVVNDKRFAENITSAQLDGRKYAGMYLSWKLWQFFGDLSDQERILNFQNKTVYTFQGHWKQKQFNFTSIAEKLRSSLTANQVGFKRKREASDTADRMNKRFRQITNMKNEVYSIIKDADQTGLRRSAAVDTLTKFETYEHLLSPKAFAFRKCLSQGEPHREKCSDKSYEVA